MKITQEQLQENLRLLKKMLCDEVELVDSQGNRYHAFTHKDGYVGAYNQFNNPSAATLFQKLTSEVLREHQEPVLCPFCGAQMGKMKVRELHYFRCLNCPGTWDTPYRPTREEAIAVVRSIRVEPKK